MDPGAVQQFHAAQARLLDETYVQAWHHGVASYEPDEDPAQPGPSEDEADIGLAAGAGAVLLAVRLRPYRPPALPDPEAQAEALGGARKGLDRMVGELLATVPTSDHLQQSTDLARAGEIPPGEIMQHAEALAVEEWADSNAWRLNAGDSVAWTGEQDGYAQAANADGQLLEWLPEADERVCGDCEELAGLPPMPLADWPTRPGAGDTICNAGCRCVMQASDEQVGPEGELPPLSQDEEATIARIAEAREPGEWSAALTSPPPALFGASVPVLEPTASQQAAVTQLGRMSRENFHTDPGQKIADPEKLWAQGEKVKPAFDQILQRAGDRLGAIEQVSPGARAAASQVQHPLVITAPLKAKDGRGLEKVKTKYAGDFTKLKDIVRGTIAVPSMEELPAALHAIVKEADAAGWKVTGLENRFTREQGSKINTGANTFGYKDLSMHLVSPDGHVAELQINTIPLMVAKEQGGGHQFYDQVRPILEKKTGDRTLAEQRQLDKATVESRRVYGLAERATPPAKADAVIFPERVAGGPPRAGEISEWPGKPALITRIDQDGRVHFRYVVAGQASGIERSLTPAERTALLQPPKKPSLLDRLKRVLSLSRGATL